MLVTALVAFGLTLAISPVVLVGLRRLGVLDIPSHRSSHVNPTPRGGGVAVGIGSMTALLTASSMSSQQRIPLLLAACGFGLVGLLDDLFDVPALWRLAIQVATAACTLPWLVPSLERSALWQVGAVALTTVWLVGYVNAFNFMDGIDGISVMQVVVAGATWIVIAELRSIPMLGTAAVVVAAAAVGFAPFNFPQAKMFLGDAGSYFIGGWLAALVILGLLAGVPAEAMLGPLALYVTDTGTTFLRRLRSGQIWFDAHRDHTYQHLVDHGWSHSTTTLVVGMLLVIVSALGLLSLTNSLVLRLGGDIVAVAVLAAYVRVPTWLAGQAPTMTPAHP